MLLRQEITSRENPAVKEYVKLLRSRAQRYESGLFVTEGEKLTREALQAGCVCKNVFVTAAALESFAKSPVTAASQTVAVSDSVAAKMSDGQSTQGVFGVFFMLDNKTQPVKIKKSGAYVILASLQDPGNVGTILRTAAALGIDGVFVSADCPDIYGLKVLRACMGGVFKLDVRRVESVPDTIALLRESGVSVWAAALHRQARLAGEAQLCGGCAVVIGNEGAGLSEQTVQACDGVIMLPMREDSESLNAAMAAGILMWEMGKSRLLEK